MKTYKDAKGVTHVMSRQYPDWTLCQRRFLGPDVTENKLPTCLWCLVNRLWRV